MSKTHRMILLVLVLAPCVGCDQVTKSLASRHLAGSSGVSLLNGIVHLGYAENSGAFLGLGSGLTPAAQMVVLVIGVGILLACLVAYLLAAKRLGLAETVAASLMVAGGLGNLLDRVALGFVRDFAVIGIGPVRSGVFNVADAAITAGACVLLWHLLGKRRVRAQTG